MELFAQIVKNEKLFTIFARTSILDVWQGSEYASELAPKVKDISFLHQFNDTRMEELRLYWKNSLKCKVGRFWSFSYVYAIN